MYNEAISPRADVAHKTTSLKSYKKKIMPSTKDGYAVLFQAVAPPSIRPQNCLQSLDLVHPKSIWTIFECPTSIKAFSSYVSTNKMHKNSGITPSLYPNFFYEASIMKALQPQYQSNGVGYVMSVPARWSWMGSLLHIFQILNNTYFEGRAPRANKQNHLNKNFAIYQNGEILYKKKFTTAIRTSPSFVKSLDLVHPKSSLTVFEWPKSVKTFWAADAIA